MFVKSFNTLKNTIPFKFSVQSRRCISKWFNQPTLPSLKNEEYLNILETYAKTIPQANILLVWGPQSFSKRDGLNLKAAEWRKQGHPVIDIDLKDVRSIPSFKERIMKAVRLSKLHVNEATHLQINTSTKTTDDITTKQNRGVQGVQIISRCVICGLSVLRRYMMRIFSTWVRRFDMFIQPDKIDNMMYYFERLEVYAKKSEKTPIVIWRDIQNIAEIRKSGVENIAQEFIHRLFLHYEQRNQGNFLVPVICESSELWNPLQNDFSTEVFRPYLIQPFLTREKAKSWLVDSTIDGFQEPIFSEAEFEIIWEYSGGHLETLYLIHNMLREGQTLEAVLDDLKRQYFARLSSAINEGSGVDKDKMVSERKHFLRKLQISNYSLTVEDTRIPVLQYLVGKKILFTDGKIVYPQNRPLQLSIDEYLKLFILNKKVTRNQSKDSTEEKINN
jgi:hypothetical protein